MGDDCVAYYRPDDPEREIVVTCASPPAGATVLKTGSRKSCEAYAKRRDWVAPRRKRSS